MTDTPSGNHLQTLLNRGYDALGKGDLETAGTCCQQALATQADLVPAHFLVGLVALEGKQRKTAFSAFQSVVKLQPEHAAAWAQLARLHMSGGQVVQADAALRETLRLQPDDAIVLDLIGTTLSLMGEHGVAATFYARANTVKPDHPPLMQNLANNSVYQGDIAYAEALFRKIITLRPDSPQAHWGLSGCVRAIDLSHVEQMQLLARQNRADKRAQAFYLYAIGKELEDLEQWQDAFDAFSDGAAARRTGIEYDEKAEIALFAFLQQQFTAEWLARQSPGNPDSSPIFVLGQPRTGTTLIERIISSHSRASSAGELQQFGLALRRLSHHRDPRRFTVDLFQQALALDPAKVGGLYLQSSKKMRGSTAHFVDKLPQNYLMIPLLLAALPNAKIVHVVRHPMDACFASFKQLFADAYLHSYEQGEMARHHARYYRLMQHWQEQFEGRIFNINYEATVQDLETNARGLIQYLELPWEDACLEFHLQQGPVSTASAVQVREPAHTRSIGRWQRYQAQLQPMREALAGAGIPGV